ncbi:hypothetical protein [Burkholderia vietnamiensis]|uniref:hypothetical protein n=1 Tax=Burkholderia vietnamiensis TaxID=60552 RepID=UPI000A82D93C|nr:hypothetical protein [Burkholderia vietnamiensis]
MTGFTNDKKGRTVKRRRVALALSGNCSMQRASSPNAACTRVAFVSSTVVCRRALSCRIVTVLPPRLRLLRLLHATASRFHETAASSTDHALVVIALMDGLRHLSMSMPDAVPDSLAVRILKDVFAAMFVAASPDRSSRRTRCRCRPAADRPGFSPHLCEPRKHRGAA